MELENVFHPLRASIALRARGWFNSYIFEIFGRSSFHIIFRSNEDLLVFDLIYDLIYGFLWLKSGGRILDPDSEVQIESGNGQGHGRGRGLGRFM